MSTAPAPAPAADVKLVLTPEQVEAGNKTLRELKNGQGEMKERMAQIDKQREALDSLAPQEARVKHVQNQINSTRERAIEKAILLGLHTSKKAEPAPASGGIIVPPGAKEAKRQRYRFKTQQEKDKEAELKAQQAALEKELQMAKDLTVLKMTQTDNPEMKAFYEELAILERDFAGETAALADAIAAKGLKCNPSLKDIADKRAELTRQKAEVEQKQKTLIEEAEGAWKKTVSEAIKTDRPMLYLVTDVMAMRNWMIDGSPGLSARELMHRLEHQQAIGRHDFAFVENLIVYSKNQERVVHCANKNGKWDFATYYEQCSLEYAQEQFAKCQGRTVSALPSAPGESSFTTTLL